MKTNVPFNDLTIAGTDLEPAVEAAIRRVVASGWFVLGPEVEAFEAELAGHLGTRRAVGVGSGTDAIALALEALGVGPGDEVVTTPLTAAFTALAISRVGATPVFADVEEETLSISPASVAERLTPRTRAVVPVHLYGNSCDLEALLSLSRSRGLFLVEDACQAHGGRLGEKALGGFGEAGAFSFYPTKNLGALGDGGMVVTDDEALAERVRRLRNGGQSSRYRHESIGANSRLDEIQAAILRVRLERLESENERRRAIARLYEDGLDSLPAIPVRPRRASASARHLMVVRVAERHRDLLAEHLRARGIGTLVHYPVPVHLQPAYAGLGVPAGSCPVAESAARRVLSLPLHPRMKEEDVRTVVDAIADFYREASNA